MNPEELEREERRRQVEELARRMVDESARGESGERGITPDIDERALARLAEPSSALQAPGRPGEAEQAISDARGPQEEYRGTQRGLGTVIGGPGRGTAPWPAEERARVAGVEQRLRGGDVGGVAMDTAREQGGPEGAPRHVQLEPITIGPSAPPEDEAEDRALSQMAQPAVTTSSPAPMAQRAQGTGQDDAMRVERPSMGTSSAASVTPAERAASVEAMRPDPAPVAGPGVEDEADDAALEQLAGRKPKAIEAHTPGPQIPGEEDFARARVSDGFRRGGRALAALFAGIGGRSLGAFRSDEEALRARARQMLGDKADQRERDDAGRRLDERAAQQAQQAEAQRALATRTADRQDAELTLAQQREARAGATADAQAAALGERTAASRAEREMGEARRDASSEVSQASQAQLRALLDGLAARPGADARLAPLRAQIDGMSAEQVEGLMQRGPAWLRDLLDRRGGRGAGGGGAPRDRSALISAAEAAGIPRAVADATPDRQLAAMVEQRGRRSAASTDEGEELLPGIRAGMDLDRGEGRAVRESFSRAMGNAGSLNRIGQIAQEFGGLNAAISREAEAALTPELTMLRSMVAQMGGTGVINPTEVPAINAALPNPSELQQMTFGTFDRRLRTWRSIVEGNVRSGLAARGVQGDDLERAMRALWSGQFEAPRGAPARTGAQSPAATQDGTTQPAPDTVRVRLPDGRVGNVPRANVDRLVAAGAEVL